MAKRHKSEVWLEQDTRGYLDCIDQPCDECGSSDFMAESETEPGVFDVPCLEVAYIHEFTGETICRFCYEALPEYQDETAQA